MVSTIRLSTDELAFTLLIAGHSTAAQQALLLGLGREISKEEARGRLSAAGNVLFGRGLVMIGDDGSVKAVPILAEVGRVLTGAAATLRFTLNQPDGPRVLSYHYIDGAIYEHWLERGVTHVISRVEEAAISDGCRILFDIADRQELPNVTGQWPDTAFRQMMRQRDPAVVAGMLREYGLEGNWVDWLAEDIVRPQAIGDMLAIYYHGEERAPMADEGRLIALGNGRFWLFHPVQQDGEAWIRLLPSTNDSLQAQLHQLVQVCREIAARQTTETREMTVNGDGASLKAGQG
ncbi:MAG: hypothetical protein D6687_01125 [Acidobacteria bacterium]|jgi:hypothetical protein|nr:MAG: hypothetical protein D6687_01125 [Acidobacteriota bacterium]